MLRFLVEKINSFEGALKISHEESIKKFLSCKDASAFDSHEASTSSEIIGVHAHHTFAPSVCNDSTSTSSHLPLDANTIASSLLEDSYDVLCDE